MTVDKTQEKNMNSKSAENTVFVRFNPPSSLLRRHHIEHHFSQVGPIKKASLIIPKKSDDETDTTKPSSYGFIKYTCLSDAQAAAKQLNRSTLSLPAGEQQDGEPSTFQVKVELASEQVNKQKKKEKTSDPVEGQEMKDSNHNIPSAVPKKHSRVILRNLSFYAKESHIQEAMKEFGPLAEVHLPKVDGRSRGFAFCTFKDSKDAQKAINACQTKPLQIKQRNVQVEFSVPKAVHQVQKEKEMKLKRKREYQEKVREETKQMVGGQEFRKEKNGDGDDDDDDNSASSSESEVESKSGSDNDDSSDSDSGDGDSEDDSEEQEDEGKDDEESVEKDGEEKKEEITEQQQEAIQEQRELFVRNLPFDASRHDVFEIFRKFGKIAAIYLVSDPKTGLPRGTCFVTYDTQAGATRAVKAGATKTSIPGPSAESAPTTGGIVMKGRSLLIDYAVDRETANTLRRDFVEGEGSKHKDKRNLYLKGEGRVDEDSAWAAMGERDQTKRQSAWSDKITKLKSPLFFINPYRLSIRNISKSVDEGALKQLLFDATKKGLEKRLVSVKDQEAQWRAAGEMSAREILEKKKALKTIPDEGNPLKPSSLDDKNTKKTLPSVYLDRDFAAVPDGKKKALAPSRGFAFAEFEHHVQALACLRELNNNPAYSEAFAAGGKAATNAAKVAKKRSHKKKRKDETDEEAIKVPRLIVEFTVENKAKARQQADRRAQQQANKEKQKLETREKKVLAASSADGEEKKSPKKRSRGAKQREKKRQRLLGENGKEERGSSVLEDAEAKRREFKQAEAKSKKQQEEPKGIKPPKKQNKRQRENTDAEAKFARLVDKYKAAFVETARDTTAISMENKKKEVLEEKGKRWFE